ncbi:MAG: nucleotide pyrophosphohydrolase [Myxococcales bacterium]|nr:nucleotide pyrophosphohydrolase [Myxococcales bacterium]
MSDAPPREPDRLDELLRDVRAFVAEREWEPYHDPKNLVMALVSEAGELAAELRWVPGEEADAFCRADDSRQRVLDELADVTLCVLMLADRIGADLPAAVHDKLRRIRVKYPPGS